MTTRLPLVAAQPGIWMASASPLCRALGVAHYVELRGALDPTLLGKAIVAGLQQADTLSLRFEEEEEVWQWLAADRTFGEPSIIDLRTAPDPHRAATERMQADLAQDHRVDGGVTRWCAISCCASATTAGTGISVITICWWMALASRR